MLLRFLHVHVNFTEAAARCELAQFISKLSLGGRTPRGYLFVFGEDSQLKVPAQ